MKKTNFLLLILTLNLAVTSDLFASQVSEETKTAPYTIGTELDALPFATGGYYFSLIGGHDHFRLRGIASMVNPPDFAYPSDRFKNLSLHAYALIVDYFFKPEFDGFWVGVGLEKWLGTIDSKVSSNSGSFNESVSTLGSGYVWKFYKNFYLNPWVAIHLKVSGDSPNVGIDSYTLPTLQGEGSFKIGWYF